MKGDSVQLYTNGLPREMIDFLTATIGGTTPETAFRLVLEAGRLNEQYPLLMENENEVQVAQYADENIPLVATPLEEIENDPWLVIEQMMYWVTTDRLPTLHQICFFAGTLRHRRQHTAWELEHIQGFRKMVDHLLAWHDRVEETAHPNAYRVACWMAVNAILFTTEAELGDTTEPWDTSRIDLAGLRLVYSRIDELSELITRLGLQQQDHLGTDDIRWRVRHIAKAIWPGFDPNHGIDDEGNPLNDDGEAFDIITEQLLPKHDDGPMDVEEMLAGLSLPPEYQNPKTS